MYRMVFMPPTWTDGVGFNLQTFELNAVLTGHLVSLTRERGLKFSVQIRDLYIATSENKPGSSHHCLSGHRNQQKSQRIESHTCIINLPEDSRESLKPAQNVIEEVFIFIMIYL